MTNANFPERWLNDVRFLLLTDAAYRSYGQSLQWAVANRTDGQIDSAHLSLIPNFTKGNEKALVSAGLWEVSGHGYMIVDFATTQTSRAQLEVIDQRAVRKRAGGAERQARSRKKKAGVVTEEITRDVTRDKSVMSRRDLLVQTKPVQAGTTGPNENDETANESVNESTGEVGWPVAEIPNSDSDYDRCRVCNNKLVSEPNRASGLCRKGDAAHVQARAA